VIKLTAPSGDLLYRMAMPATGPIPAEVAKCFTGANANKYGRNLVASGPYMFGGLRQRQHRLLLGDQAGQWLRRPDEHDARPQPELQREHRLEGGGGRNLPDSFVSLGQLERGRHLQQGRLR